MTIEVIDDATNNIIAGFTVTQNAAPFALSVSPASASVGSGVSSGQIQVTAPFSWTAVSTQAWVSISGSGNTSPVTYNVEANSTTSSRSMTIVILDSNSQPQAGFTVTQAAAPTPLTISPSSSPNATPSGYSGTASVSSPFAWTAVSTQGWVAVTWDQNTLYYTATANTTGSPRSATILIDDSGGNIQAGFTVAQGTDSSTPMYTLGVNISAVPFDLYFQPNAGMLKGCSSPQVTVRACYKELFVTDKNNWIGQGVTDVRILFTLAGGYYSTPFPLDANNNIISPTLRLAWQQTFGMFLQDLRSCGIINITPTPVFESWTGTISPVATTVPDGPCDHGQTVYYFPWLPYGVEPVNGSPGLYYPSQNCTGQGDYLAAYANPIFWGWSTFTNLIDYVIGTAQKAGAGCQRARLFL